MNTPQIAHQSWIDLILQSGLMAKFVLILLLAASILCWAIMLLKWKMLRQASRQNQAFLDIFWKGKSIDEIYTLVENYARSPVARVFESGFRELKKLSNAEIRAYTDSSIDNIQRALSRTLTARITELEKHISWLGTTASAAPFVGLFGTVWGIINSFQNIGATGSANLAVVAPGISEALITTAMGIAAAIPAVVAYNHFVGQIRRIAIDTEGFSKDFLNILQRNLMTAGGPK